MVEGSLSRKELFEQAREATRRRDWPEAFLHWEAVRMRFPDEPTGYANAGNALRGAGRLDEAEALLAAAMVRFPGNWSIALGRARTANARREWLASLPWWEEVRALSSERPEGYIGAAEALRALGRADEATALLDEAVATFAATRGHGLDEATALQIEIDLATARGDWRTLRQAAETLIAVQPTPSGRALLALARACRHLKDLDGAAEAAAQALAAQPALVEAALIGAQVAAEQGDGEKALSYYRALTHMRPDNPRWPLQFIRTLNVLGRVKEAMSALRSVVSRWPDDPIVRTYNLAHSFGALTQSDGVRGGRAPAGDEPDVFERESPQLAAKAPRSAQLRRALIDADPEREVIPSEDAGVGTVVLVFTGIDDMFGLPLPIFDRYLAALGVTAVYLKDFHRLLFLRGVQSLAPDYEGTLAALMSTLDGLRTKRLCTLGQSSGGLAAIRYGIDLDASRIACFGGMTTAAPLAHPRVGPRFARKRYSAELPVEMLDLRPFLESRRHRSKIQLYYGDREEIDTVQAARLEGIDGVTLHPLADFGEHNIVPHLAAKGELLRVLAAALGLPPHASG